MENRVIILDQQTIQRKLKRMAYEIWEHNSNVQEITLLGVEGSGMAVAQNLATCLQQISPLKVALHSISMNKKLPLTKDIVLPDGLDGKSIVMVDDVANSGRTLLYAMKPLLSVMPQKIMIAVLVDRKHKSFPITPDIVGYSVATTLQEHIEVTCEGPEITAAYLQ